MAVEVNLNTVSSGYNRSHINDNFELIGAALQDSLSRTGVSPNEMGADLDLNSNDLLNVDVTNTNRLFVGGTEFVVDEILAVGPAGEAATIEIGTVTTGAAGTDVIVTNVGDETNAIFDITIPRGDTGASGPGSGDMVAAQNLSDVDNAVTSFDNIKQTATDTYEGVLQLSTLAAYFHNYLSGLTLSNNVSDATNDIDIAAGVANDSTNARTLQLTSGLIKKLDASWAVGTNQGMRDTGSISNATWHIFLIMRPDTGVVDVLASLSATAPTLPANYVYFRRIGSIVRTGGTIKAFTQYGDNFFWSVPAQNLSTSTPSTVGADVALTVPTGISVIADLTLGVRDDATAIHYYLVTAKAQANTTPSASAFSMIAGGDGSASTGTASATVLTNTNGQIRYRSTDSAVSNFYIITNGWIDTRNR